MRLIAVAGLVALALRLDRHRMRARRIVRISRVVADLDRAEAFYRDGLGFQRVAAGPMDPALSSKLMPGTGPEAKVRRMRLGLEEIDLVRWTRPGPAYPAGSRSNDRWFQHMAIVVDDMQAAHARLARLNPVAISVNGPVTLPGGDGKPGVSAYKFRDPDGHPLELIHFPPGHGRATWRSDRPGPCLGIDHSALSVGSTQRSLRFYRRLGFRREAESFNHGPSQAALDGLPDATATVSSLRLAGPGPGLELLGYQPSGRPAPRLAANAILTDWVTLVTGRWRTRAVRDPDGHLLVLAGVRPHRSARRARQRSGDVGGGKRVRGDL